eukprot:maker-scaffold1604_size34042-snap-gene-0.11 protein:Tk08079 transcript:maker-scaffold1604_size34042-snap-gene-0.11-mRNA-1 annotation:"lysine-specific demethylase 6a isoform x1"
MSSATTLGERLSPIELEILSELDALAFGFLRLGEDEACLRPKQVAVKAIHYMERLVIERQAKIKPRQDSNNNGGRNPLIDPLTYCKLGHLHLLLGDFVKALSAYQKYAALTPNQCWRNTVYLYGQGLVFYHFNAFRWATQVFLQVLYIEPGFLRVNEIRLRLGIMAKVNNDFTSSLRHFQMAQISPAPCTFNEAEINFHIAHLHEIDAKSGQSLYLLGRCHASIGKVHEAFIAYRNSVDKSESNADTWCSIGVLYQQQNQPMDALQAYICAVQLEKFHVAAWTNLGILYESVHQLQDSLTCYCNAVTKLKNPSPNLHQRIKYLKTQLSNAPPPTHSLKSRQLPSVEEAWNLPVSNEMAGRQSNAMKSTKTGSANGASDANKRFKAENPPNSAGPPALTPQQLQTLHHLQSQASLPPPQQQLLQSLQSQFHAFRQYQVKMQQRMTEGAHTGVVPASEPSAFPPILGSNADILSELENKDLGSVSDKELEALISQQDIGSFAESLLKQIQADGADHHDMDVDEDNGLPDSGLGLNGDNSSNVGDNGKPHAGMSMMDDDGHLDTKEACKFPITSMDIPTKLEVVRSTKGLPVDISMSGDTIFEACKTWFESNTEFSLSMSLSDQSPPEPPEKPKKSLSKENLLPPTPSVYLENRKDASSAQLQEFCIKHPITVVRGIANALKLDLGLFSTKQLAETHANQRVDVVTQLKQNADENWDFNLTKQVWHCIVTKSKTTIAKYGQYQTATFQDSLKEEQEKGGSGYRGDHDLDGREETRRRRKQQSFLQFGMNVDMTEQRHWRAQLTELMKLPSWARVVSAGNMLTHIGYPIPGMNTVQLQMKVPCARTFARQESNNFCAIDINIGPGDCEWFAVPYEYWGAVRTLCEKHGVNFSHGSWWPNMKDLMEEEVPVYRFLQRPGDMVWVNSGCLYWVQAVGWCNNITWNVGPLTHAQYSLALERYEWNKLLGIKSRVPIVHLSWSLAKNIRLADDALYNSIKKTLVQSLKRYILILEYLKSMGIELKRHSRKRNDPAHYCSQCEREVFAILFVREVDHQHIVSCFDCAKCRSPDLQGFVCLEECRLKDVMAVYDSFRLQVTPAPPTTYGHHTALTANAAA